MGVWIETCSSLQIELLSFVTPFVGVWIETPEVIVRVEPDTSHPSWVCGLKLQLLDNIIIVIRHTLRGCVD